MRIRLMVLVVAVGLLFGTLGARASDYSQVTFTHTNGEGINANIRTDANGQTCAFVANGKAQGGFCWTGASQAPTTTAWSDSNGTHLQITPHVGMAGNCVIAYTKYIDMEDERCVDGCADCGCMMCISLTGSSSESIELGPGPF